MFILCAIGKNMHNWNTETVLFPPLSHSFFFFFLFGTSRFQARHVFAWEIWLPVVSNVLEIEETTLFLSLSAFQSEHSGLGTFPIKSKETFSFLHFYCMLREEEGAVHILTKSVLELPGSKGSIWRRWERQQRCSYAQSLSELLSFPPFSVS